MKTITLFTILSLLSFTRSQKCSSNILVTTNKVECRLFFKIDGNNCSTSIFDSCILKYCADEKGSACLKYNSYVDNDYANCMNSCCGGNMKITNTFKAGSECPNKNIQGSSIDIGKVITIIMITFGISMLLIFMVFCIYRRFSHSQEIRIMNDMANPQAAKINNGKEIQMDQASIQNLLTQFKWQKVSVNVLDLPDCQICLSDTPNLKLKCGHYFHPNCLRLWLKKKFECGVCRGNDLSNVDLICRKCFKKQIKVDLRDFVKLKRNYNKMVCQACRPQ